MLVKNWMSKPAIAVNSDARLARLKEVLEETVKIRYIINHREKINSASR